ncbi:Integrin beta subunit VWA domain-containing protein [Nostoc sp. DSM 114160]
MSLVSDIVLLQDLTSSSNENLVQLKTALPVTVNRLTNPKLANIFGDDLKFGIASFKDKPLVPFGGYADYVYQPEVALTNNVTTIKDKIFGFQAFGGNDGPESQLFALLFAALDNGSLGYRVGSFRVVIIATDSIYHVAGDRAAVIPSDTIANNGDEIADAFEDYPQVGQVKTALEENNIIPIFLTTSNVAANYETLVTQLGRGGVLTVGSTSENLADVIKEAVARARNAIGTDVTTTKGDDTFSSANFSAGDKVIFAGDGDDSISLSGVIGNHYIDGGAGSDILFGGSGADIIDGGSDDDNLLGGKGDDILFGSSGKDILSGNQGNDYLQGDSGDDLLEGGAGADKFGFATGSKFNIRELGVDVITDFNPKQDKIQLSKSTFTALSNSVFPTQLNSADFATVTNDTLAASSSAAIVYNSANGSLFYNPNRSADDFAEINSGGKFAQLDAISFPTLTTASFEVVL